MIHGTSHDIIHSFNVDKHRKKLIIVLSNKAPSASQNFVHHFKIYCLVEKEIIFQSDIFYKPLIGRLLSELYTFVDGHIYYNNNVIKIRYDLIEQEHSHQYNENQIFDTFFDIFELEKGLRVRSNTPLDSYLSHRFCYIISDSLKQRCKRLRVLPYLHERRIYLNRDKMNTDYFYTSLETTVNEQR